MKRKLIPAILAIILLAMPVYAVIPIDKDDPASSTTSASSSASSSSNTVESSTASGENVADAPASANTGAVVSGTQSRPVVHGTLTETYDVALGLYEHSFEAGRSFLTNTPNGGKTQDAVFLDIPDNMKVSAEFGGKGLKYTNKSLLTNQGLYTFIITSPRIMGEGEITGVFTFRILPPHAAGNADVGEDDPRPRVREYFTASSNGGRDMIEYSFSNHRRFYSNVTDGETMNTAATFLIPPNVYCELRRGGALLPFANNRSYNEPGSYVLLVSAPTYAREGRRAIIPYAEIAFTVSASAERSQTGGTSASDFISGILGEDAGVETIEEDLSMIPEGGQYRLVFSGGESFLSSVRDGETTENPVSFEFSEGMVYELMRDGFALNIGSGTVITEPGDYILNVFLPSTDGVSPGYVSNISFTIAAPQPVESAEAEPETEQEIEADAPAQPVRALPGQTYVNGEFRHAINADAYFATNIPNGMISRLPAEISVPEEAARTLLKDGEEIEFTGEGIVSDPGSYELVVAENAFSFTVLPQYVSTPFEYIAPLGYSVTSVTRGGEPADVMEDGDYVIQLAGSDSEAGMPEFTVDFSLDTVAPTLTLNGVAENGVADGAVSLTANDPTATVTVLRGDDDIGYRGGEITESGNYRAIITDLAGNLSEYEFGVPYRLNMTAILFIVLVILMLAGGAVYFFRLRKGVKL